MEVRAAMSLGGEKTCSRLTLHQMHSASPIGAPSRSSAVEVSYWAQQILGEGSAEHMEEEEGVVYLA